MSTGKNAFLLAMLVGPVAGCSPGGVADVPRPAIVVYVDEGGGGLCASVFAVDSQGTLWSSSDCGSGGRPWAIRATVGDAVRAELDAELDAVLALPEDTDCATPTWTGRRYRFRRALPGTQDWPEKELCEPGIAPAGQALADRIATLASGG
ncbi:MAG: hypothetical protein IT378_22755 [Sandaracinaceae bacterium]|nr:hypothetical protein [Sandaracinaceae bacterium]